jgi:hypothetical protein
LEILLLRNDKDIPGSYGARPVYYSQKEAGLLAGSIQAVDECAALFERCRLSLAALYVV